MSLPWKSDVPAKFRQRGGDDDSQYTPLLQGTAIFSEPGASRKTRSIRMTVILLRKSQLFAEIKDYTNTDDGKSLRLRRVASAADFISAVLEVPRVCNTATILWGIWDR
jgi:hypothetical protein